MKRVAIIQSNYIPWKGYFDIIHDVDLFIFYDDVQYTKNDWRNRNKIKTSEGIHWLTIPVGLQNDRLIYQVVLKDRTWQKRHWEIIKQSYAKAPYFEIYRTFFEHVYQEIEWNNLSELNQYLIKKISGNFLGITTQFQDSRDIQPEGVKLDRLINLLVKIKADLYVSGPSAKDYIKPDAFETAGIKLVYKDYTNYPEYRQLYPPFEHAVSILDLLFHCGPDSSHYIWGWRYVSRHE